MRRTLRVRAPAKVNLTLEVLGERADGYHEIASVMATIDLRDDVRVGPAKALEVRIAPDVGAPRGDDLASRAVRVLAASIGREPQAHVRIRKRIPVAAGLGGGSSDAGAVLRALAQLWGVDADVAAIGATVGSDVPFFARASAVALVGGRGERIEDLPPAAGLWIALVTVPARLATAAVYASRDLARGNGRASADLADRFRRGTVTPRDLRSLARNDLATAAVSMCDEMRDARTIASDMGVDLLVSGSGPSLFAVADDRAHAISIARGLRRKGLRSRPYPLCVHAPIERI